MIKLCLVLVHLYLVGRVLGGEGGRWVISTYNNGASEDRGKMSDFCRCVNN